MTFLAHLYLNTALTSALLWGLLAVWGAYHALRSRPLTPRYMVGLLLAETLLLLLGALLLARWLGGAFARRPTLTLVYALLALVALPGVWLYTQGAAPRRAAFSLALACVFVSGMVLRALQTGMVGR